MKTVWLILLFICIFGWCSAREDGKMKFEEAYTSFNLALQPSPLFEREKNLNHALDLFLQLESSHENSRPLQVAIGDTFFYLEHYSWALLYYYKALKSDSDDALIINQINNTLAKLELPNFVETYSTLSHKFTYQLFFYLIWITFFVFSLTLWKPIKLLKYVSVTLLLTNFAFIIYIFLSFYLIPIEGVVINPSTLSSQPEITASSIPLQEGTKVKLISSTDNGEWLKVKINDGTVGYIPGRNFRII